MEVGRQSRAECLVGPRNVLRHLFAGAGTGSVLRLQHLLQRDECANLYLLQVLRRRPPRARVSLSASSCRNTHLVTEQTPTT